MESQALAEAEQRAVISKITRRLIPLLFVCYIVAYIDRINVGFAKSHLEPVLGVDSKTASSRTKPTAIPRRSSALVVPCLHSACWRSS